MICSKCNDIISMAPPNLIGFASVEYICLKCSGTINDSSNITEKYGDPDLGLKYDYNLLPEMQKS